MGARTLVNPEIICESEHEEIKMIPKIFHLTAKSKDNLPASFQKNIARIKDLYPDYEIRIYDDDDIKALIKKEMPEYYENTILKMPSFIMVVDTVRYLWMRLYGGIYCDMDVFFRSRFAFEDGAIFIEREWTYPEDVSITQSVHNCLFASVPGHPVWDEILDGIAANVRSLKGKKEPKPPRGKVGKFVARVMIKLGLQKRYFPMVFNVTGPNAISKIISDRSLHQKYEGVHIVPGKAIFQAGFSKGSLDDAYFVHETAGSWKE
jgi:hypothetical protein